MEPFATVEDLESRWRPLTPSEQERAATLLDDASTRLRIELGRAGVRLEEAGPEYMEALLIVSCEAVKRMMQAALDQPPMSSFQQSAGPYQGTIGFANPSGDFYLTKAEKRLLGLGGMRIGAIGMRIGGRHDQG